MSYQYWFEKWQQNDIRFHLPQVNNYFLNFFSTVSTLPRGSLILFPLCGKTVDMIHARDAGYRVIGIEWCEKAIRDFLVENKLPLTSIVHQQGIKTFLSNGIELYCSDIFSIPLLKNNADFVFDRAALVALPRQKRETYANQIISMLKKNAKMLLVSLRYDEKIMNGPPYSLFPKEILSLYPARFFKVEKLLEEDIIGQHDHLQKKGLKSLFSTVYLLTKINE